MHNLIFEMVYISLRFICFILQSVVVMFSVGRKWSISQLIQVLLGIQKKNLRLPMIWSAVAALCAKFMEFHPSIRVSNLRLTWTTYWTTTNALVRVCFLVFFGGSPQTNSFGVSQNIFWTRISIGRFDVLQSQYLIWLTSRGNDFLLILIPDFTFP